MSQMYRKLKSLLCAVLIGLATGSLFFPVGWEPFNTMARITYAHPKGRPFAEPIHQVRPIYTRAMLESNTIGGVVVKFEINERGEVENPCVVFSTAPGKYELSALHAIKQFKFEPKLHATIEEGNPSEVVVMRSEAEWLFNFGSTALSPSPTFPKAAINNGIAEGMVIIEFELEQVAIKALEGEGDPDEVYFADVTWVYAPTDLSIAYAEPKNVFEEAALHALDQERWIHHPYYNFQGVHYPWLVSADERPPTPDFPTLNHQLLRIEFSLDSKPNKYSIPKYPEEAIQKGVEGNVIVKFDIDTDGTVKSPNVIHSDAPGVLDTAAIDHVSKFTFGRREKISTDVLHRVAFVLNEEHQLLSSSHTQQKLHNVLSEKALDLILDWYIEIKFDINEKGTVENATIIDSNAPNDLRFRALRHALYAVFSPKIVNGRPVRVPNVEQRFIITPVELNSTDDISTYMAHGGVLEDPLYRVHADADGTVLVEFDVDEQGRVHDPIIVEANLKEYYTDFSLAVVEGFRYEPLLIDGKSIGESKVRHQFLFSKDIQNSSTLLIHLDDGHRRLGMKVEP
ncbi:MAG: TonB family protein [Gammaproteobacteria bacterium]|nr:TonB family protein [Gammaproteobacteria bacterium]